MLESKKATNLQKGCFNLWQRQMAQELNDSGITLQVLLDPENYKINIPVTEFLFKELFTVIFLKYMYNAKSISELSSDQINELYDAINNAIGERYGVSLPFPSEEALEDAKNNPRRN